MIQFNIENYCQVVSDPSLDLPDNVFGICVASWMEISSVVNGRKFLYKIKRHE